jgi:hypothetical protein
MILQCTLYFQHVWIVLCLAFKLFNNSHNLSLYGSTCLCSPLTRFSFQPLQQLFLTWPCSIFLKVVLPSFQPLQQAFLTCIHDSSTFLKVVLPSFQPLQQLFLTWPCSIFLEVVLPSFQPLQQLFLTWPCSIFLDVVLPSFQPLQQLFLTCPWLFNFFKGGLA